GPAVSLAVPSPVPTVTGPVVVPFPPVASTWPCRRRWKTPGSSAGTVTFRSSIVAVHRVDVLDAVAVVPFKVHATVSEPANAVSTPPGTRPGWNTVGCPRSAGPGANPFESPTGTVTGKLLSFRYPHTAT